MIKISLVNQSTAFADADLPNLANALQIQVTRDLYPAWGVEAQLYYTPSGKHPTADHWVIALLDNADQAGALGYHDITPAGLPLGKSFIKTTLTDGGLPSVTTSHELLEMLIDPDINLTAEFDDASGAPSKFYAYEVCITGDTLIPLLDGSHVPIAELVGREKFWVYSCSEHGYVRPGLAHSARLTCKNAAIVRVELDNGESIRCTADHQFLMRDGSYRKAKDLVAMDSLMPLYRKREPLDKYQKLDYEWVYVPVEDRWEPTHRISHPRCPKGWVRHHIDFNRFNNAPYNLEVLTWEDHHKLHQEKIREISALPQSKAAKSRNMRIYNQGRKGRKCPELCVPHPNQTKEAKMACAERGRKVLVAYNKSDAHRAIAGALGRESLKKLRLDPTFQERLNEHAKQTISRYNGSAKQREDYARYSSSERGISDRAKLSARALAFNGSPEHLEALRRYNESPEGKENNIRNGAVLTAYAKSSDNKARLAAFASSKNGHKVLSDAGKKRAHLRWHVARGVVRLDCHLCASATNHKVVSVTSVGAEDVYDLTVDKYHNFAVGPGVFVHNCDAVEADGDGYAITPAGSAAAAVTVSDFVLPAWFESFRTAGPYDFRGLLTAPFSLHPGGYIGMLDLGNLAAGWQQVLAQFVSPRAKLHARPRTGSRRLRRLLRRDQWVRSTYAPGSEVPVAASKDLP